MKIIILAAGRGTRISKLIGNIPKCTVDVCGKPLIIRTLELFKKNGVEAVAISLGYKHDVVSEVIKGHNVREYYNPFFHVTNSIASLWFALKEFDGTEDVIICNGDVFWTQEVFDAIAKDERDIVMLADRSKADSGDYFFKTDNGKLLAYGKELTRDNRDCEYVGIAKISKEIVPLFKERLLKLINSQECDKWWENILYSMVGERDIYIKDVEGAFWAEVDFIEDYNRILTYVGKNTNK